MHKLSSLYFLATLLVVIISTINAQPFRQKRAEHSEKPSDNSRARLLLDSVGASGNIMKAAQSIASVGVDAAEVSQQMFNEDANEIVKHGQRAVDNNTNNVGNVAKSMVQTGGDISKSAFEAILTVPRFFVESFGTVVGADIKRD